MSEATEATNVNKDPEVITNDKGLKYAPGENRLVVKGVLTNFRYSTTKYRGDKATYQVSVHTTSLTSDIVADIKARYFSDTKDKYLPSFIKDIEKAGDKDPVILISSLSMSSEPSFRVTVTKDIVMMMSLKWAKG